jgi:nitrogen fixation protein FixH
MKLNWGFGILVTILVFAGMMSYLVIQCLHTRYDLVASDYYKQELEYQKIIDGSARAQALGSAPEIGIQNRSVYIQMPSSVQAKGLQGSVSFYCPTDEQKDRSFALAVNEAGRQTISLDSLQPGPYAVKLSWSSGQQFYYTEKSLLLK